MLPNDNPFSPGQLPRFIEDRGIDGDLSNVMEETSAPNQPPPHPIETEFPLPQP